MKTGAITAAEMLAAKGLDSSSFHFPIAIAFNFKGMADLSWWKAHSARFAAKRVCNPGSEDSDLHWGKVLSSCPVSLWDIESEGVPIVFAGPLLYGPWVAAALEELRVFGLRYVIGVSAVGAFSERLSIGEIVIAESGVVSDGASKAYTADAMAYPSPSMQTLAEESLRRSGRPVKRVCVWQSDALYRESLEAREEWRRQGAECVNCETSTLYAVSKDLGIECVSLNWVSDSTCSGKWTGWGGIASPASAGAARRSPLDDMEDLAIEIARDIKRREFGANEQA